MKEVIVKSPAMIEAERRAKQKEAAVQNSEAEKSLQMAGIKKELRAAFLADEWDLVLSIAELWLGRSELLRPIDIQTLIWHKHQATSRLEK